jgi:hypothetical protein
VSWIVKDLWDTLEKRRAEFENLWKDHTLRAFEKINWIASEVGERWGVLIQINFPPGQERPDVTHIGHRNLSVLVDKNRKRFESVTEDEVKKAAQRMSPLSFDLARFGHEGFRAKITSGQIDCLPSGIHLWCNITPEVLEFLDWIFVNGYGLKPTSQA